MSAAGKEALSPAGEGALSAAGEGALSAAGTVVPDRLQMLQAEEGMQPSPVKS